MEIVRKRRTVKVEEYALSFGWKNMPGAGFSFPCDKQGTPLLGEMHSIAQENLAKCLSSEYDVLPRGVKDYSHTYQEPAVGRCSCGKLVELFDPLTNTCECGLEHNGCGQSLSPRSQWQEPWNDDGLLAWGDGLEAVV